MQCEIMDRILEHSTEDIQWDTGEVQRRLLIREWYRTDVHFLVLTTALW